MRVIEITKPHPFAKTVWHDVGVMVGIGSKVLVTEINLQEFMRRGNWFKILGWPKQPPVPYYYPTNLDGKSIVLIRPGGFGDLLLLTAVMRQIKTRFPTCTLALSAFTEFSPIVENLPYLDKILPYPLPLDTYEQYDYVVDFENVIERNPNAERAHAIDVLADWISLPIDDPKTDLVFTDEERWAMRYALKRENDEKLRIVYQAKASAILRSLPDHKHAQVVLGLLSIPGAYVHVIGTPEQWGQWTKVTTDGKGRKIETKVAPPYRLKDRTQEFTRMRQSALFISSADLVVAPDSAALHIAGALGIPSLGLYGPFTPDLRLKYYPKAAALLGQAPCAPCYMHGMQPMCGTLDDGRVLRIDYQGYTHPPPGFMRHQYCRAMDDLTPELIVNTVKVLVNSHPEDFPRMHKEAAVAQDARHQSP
jgi:hypothetical protein